MVAGDGGEPREISAGEVAIFKGRQWTDEFAILHRSPPITGSGSTRLLLALNPLQDVPGSLALVDIGDIGRGDTAKLA